jgi:serine O-acetyltransferase
MHEKTSEFSELELLTKLLCESYQKYPHVNLCEENFLPTRMAVVQLWAEIEEIVFPGFQIETRLSSTTLQYTTGMRIVSLRRQLLQSVHATLTTEALWQSSETVLPSQIPLEQQTSLEKQSQDIVNTFLNYLPTLREWIHQDVEALYTGDPAVRSRQEIILAYPGLRAVLAYRVAHFFWQEKIHLLARMMSEHIHGVTGIDIHPGATIGRSFYIDHGTGIVIGETTHIGESVKIYQGVSLGALSVARHMQNAKRHPTIEDHVTLYAGATILGGDTVVGHHSVVGGNVWLTRSVPPYSVVENETRVKLASKNKSEAFDPLI